MPQSVNPNPLVTIITVVYNGEKYLEDTILSVINQSYPHIEYVIIDGGSSDDSVDIIKRYEHFVKYWISESDNGIYDAMNKGLAVSTGKYVGFINSDDWYSLDAVKWAMKVIEENPACDVVFGDLLMVKKGTNKIRYKEGNIKQLNKDMSLNHPTCFVRRKNLLRRPFDTSFKVAADYDFFLHCRSNNLQFIHVNSVMAHMRSGGVSANNPISAHERFIIHCKYFSKFYGYYRLYLGIIKNIFHCLISGVMPSSFIEYLKGYKVL